MVTSTAKWRLADGVRRPRPHLLVGGSPWRAMRLTAEGASQLDELLRGVTHERLATMLCERGLVISERPASPRVADVSVVIPTVRDASVLRELIDAIPGDCAVFVVNDGAHEIGTIDDRTTVLCTPYRFSGPAVARNTGLAAVTTEFVAFIDDDVRVQRDWIARLRSAFEQPGVVIAAGRIRSDAGRGLAGYLERHACALDMGEHSGPIGHGGNVAYVPSAAFMARTSAIAPGFDEKLRVGEDVDLIWRTQGLAVYDATVPAQHAARTSVSAVLRRRFEYGTSAALLDERHPGMVTHLVVSDWTALPWLGLTLFNVAGAAVGLAASVLQGPRALPSFPTEVAIETMARGQLHAAKATSRAAVRPYWPITLAASIASRRFRRRVLPALAIGYVLGGGNPATLVDDVAYGTGVWVGCLSRRNVRPLLPAFRRAR